MIRVESPACKLTASDILNRIDAVHKLLTRAAFYRDSGSLHAVPLEIQARTDLMNLADDIAGRVPS